MHRVVATPSLHENATVEDQSGLRPVLTSRRIARVSVHCATCQRDIAPGERYRKDTWRAPVFGARLASAICADYQAVGL